MRTLAALTLTLAFVLSVSAQEIRHIPAPVVDKPVPRGIAACYTLRTLTENHAALVGIGLSPTDQATLEGVVAAFARDFRKLTSSFDCQIPDPEFAARRDALLAEARTELNSGLTPIGKTLFQAFVISQIQQIVVHENPVPTDN
jgi:hypothetical protein